MIDLLKIVALQVRVSLVEQLKTDHLPTDSQLVSADNHVSYAVDAWLVGLLATAIFFIWWFQRAYGNLTPLGARELRFDHGWSIGSWFVPFLNLVRPAQIANHTWQASDPALGATDLDWRSGPRSPIVNIW